MSTLEEQYSWFGPSLHDPDFDFEEDNGEFSRLWRGFMTARVTLGLVLVLLQGTIFVLTRFQNFELIAVCGGYFAASLAVRLLSKPRSLGRNLDPQWFYTVGVDVLTFATLQQLQGSSINYAPLFALPVLLASVLGSLLLGMGTASFVTLLLLANATWQSWQAQGEAASHFAQAALTGAGCLAVGFLANQIGARLANEEQRSKRSLQAERMQRQVNELVIESLTDGILVVDVRGAVRAINPAARNLLGTQRARRAVSFELTLEPGWQQLVDLTQYSFTHNESRQGNITIHHAGEGPRHLHARTRLTPGHDAGAEAMCVVFLQDRRELEARMRTEKLASMGRMSAAVAHEIRNPLAAISQANALLEEDIQEPRQRQLTQMVGQNAKRLEKIVEDVLNLSRVQQGAHADAPQTVDLSEAVDRICRDWSRQSSRAAPVRVLLAPQLIEVQFDQEHLRRVLINLLDNAQRYAEAGADSIQVSTLVSEGRQARLGVWSDGQPLEQSVERHLFEPFFSSESRSSGLGLFICRELCDGHGANIAYQRSRKQVDGQWVDGNEFVVNFRSAPRHAIISS
jgi:two-component system sensor histidine kinase PilS (NtrC family)